MIRSLKFFVLIGLVTCTTKKWTRKKPAYWEFPETSTTERPDVSAELCKTTDMDELATNITNVVTNPRRGLAEPLLHAVVTYVLTLHRFIRKCDTNTNRTDDIAVKMARDLILNKRPKFLDMELDMPVINLRVGFDKYEFQHFQWVLEDIQNSWEKLRGLLFDPKPDQVTTIKVKTEIATTEIVKTEKVKTEKVKTKKVNAEKKKAKKKKGKNINLKQ